MVVFKSSFQFIKEYKSSFIWIILLLCMFKFINIQLNNYFSPTQGNGFLVKEGIFFVIVFWLNASVIIQFANIKNLSKPLSLRSSLIEGGLAGPIYIRCNIFLLIGTLLFGCLFILPGVIFYSLFYFYPYLSILEEFDKENCWGKSKKLITSNIKQVLIVFFPLALMSIVGYAHQFLPNLTWYLNLMLSCMDSFIFFFCEVVTLIFLFNLLENQKLSIGTTQNETL